ncbi:TnsA endonuclease N-terminal domain-containing protein [Endozoicomonas sp. ONNA2]|uniref:TnsA endonuclease N-terminal domain-containing protein n=1 Tax=Endozoicomonas sp. ONNA2 TaxID=2828741 RepID=UPI002147C8A6|nr:TnsA endonuclease N-terminal domain-containing protein [Endozoicomonas sp. ONNA2]
MPNKVIKHSLYSRSEKQYLRWLEKELRGTGTGLNYIPGLYIHEVPSSIGNRKRTVPGIKSQGRLVQLMSDLEYKIFKFLDLAKNVLDIREQFPIEREMTLSIAEKLKIKHPETTDYNTKEKIALWITTDFLVDYNDEEGNKKQVAIYARL